jgi:crotonobetainyl-CoA:carnitine CoA-transferase CaiB-like acyl-CoA transferase
LPGNSERDRGSDLEDEQDPGYTRIFRSADRHGRREVRPLTGIRVLEVGQYISAPYCAMMLADQGAEVIKIERPGKGDPRRDYDPMIEAGGGKLSGGFLSYNRNKKSVTIDMGTEDGRDIYMRLARNVDVVVENLRPGAVDRLGVGYSDLQIVNPSLIYCAISGYGRLPEFRGPYAERPAFDTAIQAMGGVIDITGEPNGPPLTGGLTGMADIVSAVYAAFGVLCAVRGREVTGCGAFVDQSMYDSVAALLERELMLWDFTREPRVRGVDRYAPLGVLAARDGYVALLVPTDEMWRRMCVAMEREDLIDDERLKTVLQRAERFGDVIRHEAESWSSKLTRSEIVDRFSAAGVPAGEVQSVDEVYACEHLNARKMFLEMPDPEGGIRRMIRTPTLIDNYETPDANLPPELGADTDDLLVDLAEASQEEVAHWRKIGAI